MTVALESVPQLTKYPWQITSVYSHTGKYAALQPYWDEPIDNWLWSPNINLAGYPKIILKFWAFSTCVPPLNGATVELHIKGSGFDDVIWDMRRDENWDQAIWREKTFDLSSYKEKTIKIGWRYICGNPPPHGDHFILDDVLVTDPSNGGGSNQQQSQQQQSQPQQYITFYRDVGSVSGSIFLSNIIKQLREVK